jgi:hypothetical protein
VRTEQSVGRPMLNVDEARDFFGRQDHGRHCGTVNFKKQEKRVRSKLAVGSAAVVEYLFTLRRGLC